MKEFGVYSVVAVLAAGLTVQGLGQDPQSSSAEKPSSRLGDNATAKQDQDFVKKAALGGLMEVEAGKLASQKATAQVCKDFAQRMVKEHSEANEQLASLAQSKGMTAASALEKEHQQHSSQLNAKTGPEFDRAYADMMVKDHQKTVTLFEPGEVRV